MAFDQVSDRRRLGGGNAADMYENLGLSASTRILILHTVGYPAERPEAGAKSSWAT